MSNVYNILHRDLLVNKTGEDKMSNYLTRNMRLSHSKNATQDIPDTTPNKTHHFVKLIIPQ